MVASDKGGDAEVRDFEFAHGLPGRLGLHENVCWLQVPAHDFLIVQVSLGSAMRTECGRNDEYIGQVTTYRTCDVCPKGARGHHPSHHVEDALPDTMVRWDFAFRLIDHVVPEVAAVNPLLRAPWSPESPNTTQPIKRRMHTLSHGRGRLHHQKVVGLCPICLHEVLQILHDVRVTQPQKKAGFLGECDNNQLCLQQNFQRQ